MGQNHPYSGGFYPFYMLPIRFYPIDSLLTFIAQERLK